MRKLVAAGVFFEIALLIVGLTWVNPASGGPDGGGGSPSQTDYRIYGEGSGNVVEVNLDAIETVQELEPGVEYDVWTFGGTAPAPVIRVKVGDTVRFTLNNKSELGLSHSIDFHAAQTPWDENYQAVAPGESLTFDWVARFPGVFMYHCGVPPVLHHIANGMYGAIIVEPEEGLAPAREYVLVSSEFYVSDEPKKGAFEGDPAKMESADPAYVVFNGKSNQYIDAPLQAKPDELIRLYVMNAGPTLTNAFHVIGALFDRTYPGGNTANPLYGLQTYNVPPGDGAMFELKIPDEGSYPFVTHSFAYTGLGSVGLLQITADAPDAPESYPMMADPFDGGLTEVSGAVGGGGAGGGQEPAETGGAEAAGGGGGSGGEAIELGAAITGFSSSSLEADAGKVTIDLTGTDEIGHDFTIDELDLKETVAPGETATFSFDGEPGTYTFYCSIPGHRDAGMEGTITIK